MSKKSTASVTVGYVDIASFDKLDGVMYGGEQVTTLFSRSIKKHSWYTHLFAPMKAEGQSDSPSFKFSKTPDFALSTWVQAALPKLTVKAAGNGQLTWRIAYTWNLAHNIWKAGALKFNDLTAQSYDSVMLDFIAQYRQDSAKWALYQKMIGNTTALQTFAAVMPAATIKLPTPYWYARDSSYALPLCCASLNDIREEFTVEKDLGKLLRVQKNTAADVVNDAAVWVDQKASTVVFADILDVDGAKPFEVPMSTAWAKYVLVTDEERDAHQDETRDVIIEQFQKAGGVKAVAEEHRLEFHFTNPVKALFFGFQNKTSEDYNNRSNYTDAYKTGATTTDPVSAVSLIYENQERFRDIPGDHFDMEAYHHASRGPSEVGYHGLFYCMNINDLDMTGSSNFSNLVTSFEADCTEVSAEANSYSFIVRAVSAHRVRFLSSSFGFPSL